MILPARDQLSIAYARLYGAPALQAALTGSAQPAGRTEIAARNEALRAEWQALQARMAARHGIPVADLTVGGSVHSARGRMLL